MSEHPQFLTSESLTEEIYQLVVLGNLQQAVEVLEKQGDSTKVMQTWIGVQCDINNVKKDPVASERIAWLGVAYAHKFNFKRGAAILLHNISAFHMPNWDEDVNPAVIPSVVKAATEQVALRREIDDVPSFAWSWWDLGMAQLIAGNRTAALEAFTEGKQVFIGASDKDGAAWCDLFIGKAMLKLAPTEPEKGKAVMKDAAAVIQEVGEDWEKEETVKILAKVGL